MKQRANQFMAIAVGVCCGFVCCFSAELEKLGKHRVQAGETLVGLAKQAGIDKDQFYQLNGAACGWGAPEKLRVGEVVLMRNPYEFARIQGAECFDGRYSLHEYNFRGFGGPHSNANITCSWSIAWPEEKCGLCEAGLKELKKAIINSCFGSNFYADEQWESPETIEAAEEEFRRMANDLFTCNGKTNDVDHRCSQWSFSAEATLEWPFGFKQGNKWYERPVICFRNNGYANDGGNGCHSYVNAKIYDLPSGRELTERDYFSEEMFDELFDLVLKRLLRDNKLSVEDTLEKDLSKIKLKEEQLCMNVSAKGVTWWVSAYHVFPGCYGVTSVTIGWPELEKFRKKANKD